MPPKKKQKKQAELTDSLFGSEQQKLEFHYRTFKGKRICLKAIDIYGGKNKVPKGEEDYNFLYVVTAIANDTYATTFYFKFKWCCNEQAVTPLKCQVVSFNIGT